MKVRFLACLVLLAAVVIISCGKDDVNQPQNSIGDSLIVRMSQGIIPGDDTVYLINYDDNKRIRSIVDSTYGDSTWATYDSEGYLIEVDGDYLPLVIFAYNESKQLTEIYCNDGDHSERFVFEYTNGIISKKSRYSQTNANSPTLNLWRYTTYEVTNGNITNMKEYNALNQLEGETTFTFTTHPNVFKPLAFLNYRNTFGLDVLANYETIFNKNLMATSTFGAVQTTFTYTYNSNEKLTKFVVSSPNAIYTRMFSY